VMQKNGQFTDEPVRIKVSQISSLENLSNFTLDKQGLGHGSHDMKIQQVVVMNLNDDRINRSPTPPIVCPCKGIMT
jgi:hypothetical protein